MIAVNNVNDYKHVYKQYLYGLWSSYTKIQSRARKQTDLLVSSPIIVLNVIQITFVNLSFSIEIDF